MVEISAGGYSPEEMDSNVAYPMVLSLVDSEWAEVVGCIAEQDRIRLFFRTPILIPAFAILRTALADFSPPDGASVPVFGYAQPEVAPGSRVVVDLDPVRLDVFDLTFSQVILGLEQQVRAGFQDVYRELPDLEIARREGRPIWMRDLGQVRVESTDLPPLGCVDRVIQVVAPDHSALGEALDSISASLHGLGRLVFRIPQSKPTVHFSLDREVMARLGVSTRTVRDGISEVLGREETVRTPRRVVLRLRPSPMDKLLERTIRLGDGQRIPLAEVVRIQVVTNADVILRLGPSDYTGFIGVALEGDSSLEDQLASTPGQVRVLRPGELGSAEKALLGWRVPESPCQITN